MVQADNKQQPALTIQLLEKRVNSLEHELKIKQTLLDISNAVDKTPNLTDLFLSIHKTLDSLIDVPNIYISIYDREKGILHFPYFIDEADGTATNSVRIFEKKSLTGEVILKEKPLLLNKDDLIKRHQENKIVGTAPQIYLGVPLITDGVVIGILAIQNYDDPHAYTLNDLEMLVSISRQIAVAIERKRVNDALKDNEERYRILSENSHDIIMRFDRLGRHLYVNPAIKKLGYSPQQMIGKTHRELNFSAPLVEQWEAAIQDVFNTREVHRIEFELPQKKWVDWLLCPEFSGENDVNSVITFARDITQRKQMEFQSACYDRINKIIINAIDMEQMLNGILDAMNDIFGSDRAWILFPCNPKARSYEVPFLRCRDQWYVPPGDTFDITPEASRIIEEIVTSQNPVVFDSNSQRKVRSDVTKERHVMSQIAMAVFPRTGDAWEVGLHQCSHNRIWTAKESQLFNGICQRIADGLSSMLLFRELRRAKIYIDNVVNSMPSILIGVDVEGDITQWNTKAADVTGIKVNAAMGKSLVELFPYLSRYRQSINTAIKDQKVIEKTKVPHLVGGATRYENITVYPLKDCGVKGAVIRMDDVTEQIQIEEMMIQSEKMLSVGGLAAGMAHEINNPLAGMMQNAQVLLQRLTTKIPGNVQAASKAGVSMDAIEAYVRQRNITQQLEHINEAGIRAARVVDNMLSFAKKGEGARHYENLPGLLERTIELAQNDYDLKKRFDFKKIAIKITGKEGIPDVLCEASKIQQVFLNIIKNGAEAMAELEGTAHWSPAFYIHYFIQESTICIHIEDSGPGMSEDVRKRVFEPFFTTKSVDQGTGLGLSVAYFIITEDHQGKLSVESLSGKGTVFTIALPIHG